MKRKDALLKKLITEAYENVPYYNNIYNEVDFDILDMNRFEELPIVCKDDIKEYGIVNFISQDILEIYNTPMRPVYTRSEYTSGTTAEPIEIIWDHGEYFASIRHHWNIRAKYQIYADSRVLKAKQFPVYAPKDCIIEKQNLYINLVCRDEAKMCQVIQEINEFKPEWIYMSASTIYLLLRIAEKNHLPFGDSVRMIEYIGEPLLPHYKEYIEQKMQVPTLNMYGCTETNGIAYMCSEGKFHLMEENVYVEIVEKDQVLGYDQLGNVCVTGYYNTKTPFIRYRLNDRGILRKGTTCPCGSCGDTLELLYTRLPGSFIMDKKDIYPDISIYYSLIHLPKLWEDERAAYFTMRIVSKNNLDLYEVIFEEKEQELNHQEIEQKFADCILAYGLKNIQFVFGYQEEVEKDQHYSGVYLLSN